MTCITPRRDRPRIAVLTSASGDHDHLIAQVEGLTVSTWPPDLHVVTSVMDRALTRGRLPIRSDRWVTAVPVLPRPRAPFLPALDAAARRAREADVDVLVFLSVHCIPGPRLLQDLAEAAMSCTSGPTLWYTTPQSLRAPAGHYYPVRALERLVTHEANPTNGDVAVSRWAEAFAMNAHDWDAVWPSIFSDGDAGVDLEGVLTAHGVRIQAVEGAVAYRQHSWPVAG
jgi:hypothetical protein